MKRLLMILAVLAAVMVGIGFYRGWFEVARQDTPAQTDINVKVHKERIEQDTERAAEKAREVGRQLTDEVGEALDK